MKRKEKVRLKKEERELLKKQLSKGQAKSRKLTRCRILLLVDDGKKDSWIMEALSVARNTVKRICAKYLEAGLEAAVNEGKRPGAPVKFTGRELAKITAIACSDPPEGRSRWTVRLIADRVVELGVTDSISFKTVDRILKKTNLRLT